MKTHSGKLYNLIFPVYMILLVSPMMWVFMILGNFAVDSLVLLISLAWMKHPAPKDIWKKSIFRIVSFGFLADLAGSLINTIAALLWELFPYFSSRNPYSAAAAFPAIVIAGLLIYIFNSRFSFKKTGLSEKEIHRISLALALLTAPWVMMIPLELWRIA